MPNIVTGFVKNSVVVPDSPLPEGAQVEIQSKTTRPEVPPDAAAGVSTSELRKMPREQRLAILETAAEMAEEDYCSDRELTGFDAFSEEERNDDDESDNPPTPVTRNQRASASTWKSPMRKHSEVTASRFSMSETFY